MQKLEIKIKKIDYKELINSILDYINGDEPVPKELWYYEEFLLKYGILGGSFNEIVQGNSKKSKKQVAKQIISNILCWIYAIRLLVDLIIFMKIKDPNLINYYGYYGNAFGKDKVSITVLSGVMMAMFCSFQTYSKQ